MGKQRIECFDTLKGVCIIFIVFIHYITMNDSSVLGNFTAFFTGCTIPCFMMVSGAIMHSASEFNWKKYFSRFAWIYIAFVAWRAFYFVVYKLVDNVYVSLKQLIGYLFFFEYIQSINTDVMWYITSYMMVLAVFPITWHLFRTNEGRKVLMFVLGLLFLSGILIPTCTVLLQMSGKDPSWPENIKSILPFNNHANMIFYSILGAFLFEYRQKVEKWFENRRYISFIIVGVSLAVLTFIKYLALGTFTFEGFFSTPLVAGLFNQLATATMGVGLYLIFTLYNTGAVGRFLGKYVGRYTMGIYYMHFIMLYVVEKYVYPYLEPYYSFWLNSIRAIIITAICAAITILLRKIPFIKKFV